MPKGKKYGGREKGTLNKNKQALHDRILAKYPDYDPVMAMVEIAKDKKNTVEIRLTAHKEVSKYIHSQLKAIEHSGHLDSVQTITVELFNAKDQNT